MTSLVESFFEDFPLDGLKMKSPQRTTYRFANVNVECVEAGFDLREYLLEKTQTAEDGCFYTIDLGVIRQQLALWRSLLPRVTPHYAMKCNPNPVIVKLLAKLGVNFDCASKAEIEQVLELGVSPDRIIFANACKMGPHVTYAREQMVDLMTFDSVDELIKIKQLHPEARVVLRIATDDSQAVCRLSAKFGAQLEDCEELVLVAIELGLDLVGVSFHVGSGSQDPYAVPKALHMARKVFDMAAVHGVEMRLLDIGGGFPGTPDWNPSFQTIASAIAPVLDELFPREVHVIAEPGRFFIAHSHVLATTVYARRMVMPRTAKDDFEPHALYYLDDGVYGSFSCIFFDHQHPQPIPLLTSPRPSLQCTLFGPTCDALDTIAKDIVLPELHVGDWLYWRDMGAYTTASTTKFNGFITSKFHYIDSALGVPSAEDSD